MKKQLKLINLFAMALLFTTLSCKKDDEVPASNPISIQDFEVTIDENPTNGQTIGTAQADGDATPSFSITSQAPSGALSINSSTGELTVANAGLFDFETNPEITATISVSGTDNTGTVTINLNDLDEISAQDVTIALDENPTNGQSIDTIGVDGGGTLSFGISSQTPAGALSIDESTGELTVVDAALFDFETNPVITATISIDNTINTVTAVVTINLNDLDEISAQDLTVAIDENPTDGQVVGSIQVSGNGTLSFTITAQTPAGALNIDAASGELTVADPNLFDFETNPVITADIEVDNSVYTVTATATINLNDVDEVTAQNTDLDIDENPLNGDVVGTLQATGSNLTYSITFQNPAGAFNINQSTGELSVADETLFDFETNPNMLATISVDNGTLSVSANAMVALNDVNEIGEFKYGGVIFWIDPTSNNSSGLVCAVNNQSVSGAVWGCQGINISGTTINIGSGASNTALIEATCTTPGTAADLAANLVLNGFDDWFLPSRDELYEIYLLQNIINPTIIANGGTSLTSNGTYWSSSQQGNSSQNAIFLGISNGSLNGVSKSALLAVRAVRSFTDF